MSPSSSYLASIAFSGLAIIALTRRSPVVAMKVRTFLGLICLPVIDFHVTSPSWPSSSVFLAVCCRGLSITMCVDDFSACPHSDKVRVLRYDFSATVSLTGSLAMAVVLLLCIWLVGSKG